MHQPNIAHIVYQHLYPHRRPNDPASFGAHVTRNLVPEVRIETATFYGALDCIEAQYPGLDYTYDPHRRRLGRFPYHRRLFRAFDELGLTRAEILSICQWEGTKSAKEKFERDANQHIRDTTADDVALASPPSSPRAIVAQLDRLTAPHLQIIDDVMRHGDKLYRTEDDQLPGEDSDMEDDSDPSRIESIGVDLNRQLLAAAEARLRGDNNAVLDEQWEQWLKETMERHGDGESMTNTLPSGLHILPPMLREQMRNRLAGETGGVTMGRVNSTTTAFDNNNLAAVAVASSRQPSLVDGEDVLNRPSPLVVNMTTAPSTTN